MKSTTSFLAALGLVLSLSAPVSVHAIPLWEAAVAESAKPQAVAGGQKFNVPLSYDKAFEALTTALQKADYTLAEGNKDLGMVATVLTVQGKLKQTGTRVVASLIRDGEASTIVKIVVTQQTRVKTPVTYAGPWGLAVANKAKSAEVAATIKAALGVN
jgi:hypothetical protein